MYIIVQAAEHTTACKGGAMRAIRSCSLLFLFFLATGCVSMSRYNDRVAELNNCNGEITSLEKILEKSETARQSLDRELAKARENLATLQQEHETLKAQSLAASSAGQVRNPELDTRKQEFSNELATLTARLSEAQTRIAELSATLTATEEAARKVPKLESALAEREQRILDLTAYLRKMETQTARIAQDAAVLSRNRAGSEEKGEAVAAVLASLSKEIEWGEVGVREYRDKMVISMKEQILFDSGSARITRSGQRTLNRMARVLKKIRNNQIVVEGHTDTVPIGRNKGRYQTNWDLAAARATNVLKHLEQKGRISPKLLALAGYSCYLPAAANDCAKNRKLNRRIEIALVPLQMDRLDPAREKTALRR